MERVVYLDGVADLSLQELDRLVALWLRDAASTERLVATARAGAGLMAMTVRPGTRNLDRLSIVERCARVGKGGIDLVRPRLGRPGHIRAAHPGERYGIESGWRESDMPDRIKAHRMSEVAAYIRLHGSAYTSG